MMKFTDQFKLPANTVKVVPVSRIVHRLMRLSRFSNDSRPGALA